MERHNRLSAILKGAAIVYYSWKDRTSEIRKKLVPPIPSFKGSGGTVLLEDIKILNGFFIMHGTYLIFLHLV